MMTDSDQHLPIQARMDNNMNTPPNPPSPADEHVRRLNEAYLRNRIVWQMKRKFPGLPY